MKLKTDYNDQVEARLAIIGGERDLIVKEQASSDIELINYLWQIIKLIDILFIYFMTWCFDTVFYFFISYFVVENMIKQYNNFKY